MTNPKSHDVDSFFDQTTRAYRWVQRTTMMKEIE